MSDHSYFSLFPSLNESDEALVSSGEQFQISEEM